MLILAPLYLALGLLAACAAWRVARAHRARRPWRAWLLVPLWLPAGVLFALWTIADPTTE